jgi:hypothetical protein
MSREEEAKLVAIAICRCVDEDEAHIATTQFDRLMSMSGRAAALGDEGQFEVPTEALTYASLVVTFIGGLFADAAKDLVKQQLVDLLKRWISGPRLDAAELGQLRAKLERVVAHSKASPAQQKKLREAISSAFR